jgi:hypothetical protein
MVAERRHWDSGIAEVAQSIKRTGEAIERIQKTLEIWKREDALTRMKLEALHEEIEMWQSIFGLTADRNRRGTTGTSEYSVQLGKSTRSCRAKREVQFFVARPLTGIRR